MTPCSSAHHHSEEGLACTSSLSPRLKLSCGTKTEVRTGSPTCSFPVLVRSHRAARQSAWVSHLVAATSSEITQGNVLLTRSIILILLLRLHARRWLFPRACWLVSCEFNLSLLAQCLCEERKTVCSWEMSGKKKTSTQHFNCR